MKKIDNGGFPSTGGCEEGVRRSQRKKRFFLPQERCVGGKEVVLGEGVARRKKGKKKSER